jgi:thiol-disulfide isomerase/thioredoxin
MNTLYLQTALCNNKPTVIDFYAPWCESCKIMASSMRGVEIQYRNDVNFITVDGSDPNNGEFHFTIFLLKTKLLVFLAEIVGAFKVDGIPHLAFITGDNEVKTALIGAVPKTILTEEVDALAKVNNVTFGDNQITLPCLIECSTAYHGIRCFPK